MIFPPKIQDDTTTYQTYQATEYPHCIHSLVYVCCFFLCISSCHLYFLQSSKCSIPPSSSSKASSSPLAQILFLISLMRGPNSGPVLLYGFPSILPWKSPPAVDPLPKSWSTYQCLGLLGKWYCIITQRWRLGGVGPRRHPLSRHRGPQRLQLPTPFQWSYPPRDQAILFILINKFSPLDHKAPQE